MIQIAPVTEKPAVEKRYYTRMMDRYRNAEVHIPLLPVIIRTALAARARFTYARVRATGSQQQDKIDDWYREHRFFFGFGTFRSGTTLLADFLNSALPDDIVQHEAEISDYYYYCAAQQDQAAAYSYIREFRLAEIYLRMRPYAFRSYGEINPFLRRHCKAIRALLPDARLFHIVRDGRHVVRSLMSRELFSRRDPMAKWVLPPADDPYRGRWPHLSRFEKLCWLWQADNRFIRECTPQRIQFERLVANYDYFRTELLDYLDLEIDEPTWSRHVARVTNPTATYRFPAPDDWSAAEQAAFEAICGDELVACGYTI